MVLVSMLALNIKVGMGSNPIKVYSFYYVKLFEKKNNNSKRGQGWPHL